MLSICVLKELQPVQKGEHLFTRQIGAKVRDRIIDRIMSVPESVIILDFDGIKIMDVSGADELVWKLTSRLVAGELGERFLLLDNVSPLHRENISAAFNLNTDKKLAILERKMGQLSLIGPLKPMLLDVLAKVYNDRINTARKLADVTQSEINLAGTKLLQLYQKRLVRRREEFLTEGGRQFVYEPIIDAPLQI